MDLVKSWTGLVPGDYTVTETGAVGGLTKWTVDVSGSPATVPTDGGKATAGVKNTRKLGSLEVTKTVDWNGVDRRLMGRSSAICVTGPAPASTDQGCKTFTYDGTTGVRGPGQVVDGSGSR